MSLASETTAICGAINAEFSLSDPAVAPDAAAAQTADHVIVFVSRRYVDDRIASGEVPVRGARVVTRYASKSVANLSNMQAKTRTRLEDRTIDTLGPFTFESESPVDPDPDGWYVADDHWTY